MLHDAALAYEPDTAVVDVDEVPPARPRTVTDGALPMQVYRDGAWHRRTPDLSRTADGDPITTQFAPLRREVLEGRLCERGCFTPFELAEAAKANAKRNHDTK